MTVHRFNRSPFYKSLHFYMSNNYNKILVAGGLFTFLAVGAVFLTSDVNAQVTQAMGLGNRYGSTEEVQTAVENNDYEAWQETVTASGRTSHTIIDSQEDFDKLVSMHEAREAGDLETAEQIRQELGFPQRGSGVAEGSGYGRNAEEGQARGVRDGTHTEEPTGGAYGKNR